MAVRHHRRHARRNPAVMGISLPPIQSILYVGAGLVVPPLVANYAMGLLPAAYQTSRPVFYAVKAASVIVPAMAVRRFVSREAGNLMLLGGAASFVIDLVKESGLIPGLAGSQPMLGFYPSIGRRNGQGSLGKYVSIPNGNVPLQQSKMVSTTPTRLDPSTRY